jgi:predicted adenylyl cyclase CyaB
VDVKLGLGVRHRPDDFGGVCYVPVRDDFWALDKEVYPLITKLSPEWRRATPDEEDAYAALAAVEICETRNPASSVVAYSGPAFAGHFLEIPTVSDPLVLNCFSTAHCPLKCLYCHADDLMAPYRASERDEDLDNVVATATAVPALVAVITGGDPLTRPARAIKLIERLSGHKALVLDTSGVGDFDSLQDIVVSHRVHVRVSLDSLGATNDRIRPLNLDYVKKGLSSGEAAQTLIRRCLSQQIPLTVQTVVSSRNEHVDELRHVRDWLVRTGVRNWVIHVAVEGGSARKIQREARRKRRGGILPSEQSYAAIWNLIRDTSDRELSLDIRCTDTGNTPNSVLLVGSTGDLFTEGYAHKGKVPLYSAADGRPDRLKALWPHVDRFGHARRYLNWNPWFYSDQSLEDVCYRVPLPANASESVVPSIVETESKHRVIGDLGELADNLLRLGFKRTREVEQRDEYFDTPGGALSGHDYVVRLRFEDGLPTVSVKGPRFFTDQQAYSRLELEFPGGDIERIRAEFSGRGLIHTWTFEKHRAEFRSEQRNVLVAVDEVPELGYFVEIEGSTLDAAPVREAIQKCISAPERRNYKELFLAMKTAAGVPPSAITGAEFPR